MRCSFELAQKVHQELRAADGEGRDDDYAAALRDAIDHVGEGICRAADPADDRDRRRWIRKVHSRRAGRLGIVQDRLVVAADVAGEDYQSLFSIFGDGEFEPSRAEDVAGIVRAYGKFGADLKIIGAGNFFELRESGLGPLPRCKAEGPACACE